MIMRKLSCALLLFMLFAFGGYSQSISSSTVINKNMKWAVGASCIAPFHLRLMAKEDPSDKSSSMYYYTDHEGLAVANEKDGVIRMFEIDSSGKTIEKSTFSLPQKKLGGFTMNVFQYNDQLRLLISYYDAMKLEIYEIDNYVVAKEPVWSQKIDKAITKIKFVGKYALLYSEKEETLYSVEYAKREGVLKLSPTMGVSAKSSLKIGSIVGFSPGMTRCGIALKSGKITWLDVNQSTGVLKEIATKTANLKGVTSVAKTAEAFTECYDNRSDALTCSSANNMGAIYTYDHSKKGVETEWSQTGLLPNGYLKAIVHDRMFVFMVEPAKGNVIIRETIR